MSDYRYDHPLEEDLHAYLDGELPAGQMGALAEHLEECASCRTQLMEIEALFHEIESLREVRLEGSYARAVSERLAGERSAAQGWRWALLVQLAAAGILAWLAMPLVLERVSSGWHALPGWFGRIDLAVELHSAIGALQAALSQAFGNIQAVFSFRLPALPAVYSATGWWAIAAVGGVLWLMLNRWLLANGGESGIVRNRRT
jgi:anti-sigma factor RsiW